MRLLLTITASLISFNLFAGSPIIITDESDRYEVKNHGSVLIDPDNELKPENLFSTKYDSKMEDILEKINNASNKNATYWIKFRFKDISTVNNRFFLEAFDPKIEYLTFYYRDENGKVQKLEQGNAFPFSQKKVRHKNYVLPLIKSAKEQTIVAKIKSYRTVSFRMVIRKDTSFINYSLREYLFLGFFIGLIVMILIFNGSLFFSTKERTYLFYIFFVLSNLVFLTSMHGIGFQIFWANNQGFNQYASPFALISLDIFLFLYIRTFLKLKEKKAWLDKLMLYTLYARILVFLLAITVWSQILYETWIDLIPFAVAFFVCIKAYKWEKSAYKFLLIGFFCLFSGFVLFTLWQNGVFKKVLTSNNQLLFVYSLDIATILEMTFFSIAISKSLRNIIDAKIEGDERLMGELVEKEKLTQKVNLELEEKVKERTEEIRDKNDELREANERLEELMEQVNEFNVKLDLENRALSKDIKNISQSRITLEEVSYNEFLEVFPEEFNCYKMLEELKWSEGFTCVKCQNDKFNPGNMKFSRRCTKCNYEESVTVNTLFHRLRFPITKAFYMVYLITQRNGKITVDELQDVTELRRATCWSFRKKVIEAHDAVKARSGSKGKLEWEKLILTDVKTL